MKACSVKQHARTATFGFPLYIVVNPDIIMQDDLAGLALSQVDVIHQIEHHALRERRRMRRC
jgi:hypothetical protein